jgi:type IV pilus assembly protein PilN
MGHADLRKTENTHGDSRMPYTFGLDVALSRPKSDDQDPDKMPIMPAAASTSAAPASRPPVPPAAMAPAAAPAPAMAPAKPGTVTKPPVAPQAAGGKV